MVAFPAPAAPRWIRAASRAGLIVLLVSVAAGLIGTLVYAAIDPVVPEQAVPGSEACPEPPCFDVDLPSGVDLLVALPVLGYLLATFLGVPSGLVGVAHAVRRRRREAWASLLPFLGPLVVLVGYELVPHVVNPCLVADSAMPGLCEGTDAAGRWHGLHHTLLGAVPLTWLYLRMLTRRRRRQGAGP